MYTEDCIHLLIYYVKYKFNIYLNKLNYKLFLSILFILYTSF